jgi:tRNA-2-methylthio-N6-dimethylallyladenosine synthase
MLKYDNICNYIHLPAQSGNSRILGKMNRTYDREWYDSKLSRIRELIPDCGVSCDIITGFCSETDSEHRDTLDLMRKAEFDFSYMYFYSERPGTLAARKFEDDVPEELKKLRLSEVIAIQNEVSQRKNREREGKVFRVLIEGESKKSPEDLMGRTDQNIVCIFPREDHKKGEYVNVLVERSTITSLIGRVMPQ